MRIKKNNYLYGKVVSVPNKYLNIGTKNRSHMVLITYDHGDTVYGRIITSVGKFNKANNKMEYLSNKVDLIAKAKAFPLPVNKTNLGNFSCLMFEVKKGIPKSELGKIEKFNPKLPSSAKKFHW